MLSIVAIELHEKANAIEAWRGSTVADAEHRRQSSAQSQRVDTSTVRTDQCIAGNREDISAVLDSVERRRRAVSFTFVCQPHSTRTCAGHKLKIGGAQLVRPFA